MATRMGPGAMMLAATICRRYYIDGDSKIRIAEDLGISRFQVARLLDLAVERGIITFHIETPGSFDPELSEELRKGLGLRRAVVIDIPDAELSAQTIRDRVGRAAGAVLAETVTENDVLGIGWGRTLSSMAGSLETLARCPVVQMVGMVGSVHDNSLELVRQVSAVGHGRPYPLYVPLLLDTPRQAQELRRQSDVAAAMKLFESITVGAVAVGAWDPPDSQVMEGLSAGDRTMLSGRGIVGEICSCLLRDDGSTVTDLEERAVAIRIDQLRSIEELILVAGGANKARAVRAATRAGLGTTLVTDRSLARAVLDAL